MDKYLLLKQLFEQHEDIENARKWLNTCEIYLNFMA